MRRKEELPAAVVGPGEEEEVAFSWIENQGGKHLMMMMTFVRDAEC